MVTLEMNHQCRTLAGHERSWKAPSSRHGLLAIARRLVRRKVSNLIFRSRIDRADQEDAEQDAVVHLLTRLKAFDPYRGDPQTFIGVTLDHFLANWIRNGNAEKRVADNKPLSLSSLVPGQLLGQRVAYDHRSCRSSMQGMDAVELELDIALILDQLPPNLRDIASELRFRTKAEVARRLKISPTSVYHGIRRLRKLFAAIGFGPEQHDLAFPKGTLRSSRSSEGKRAQNPHAACGKVG